MYNGRIMAELICTCSCGFKIRVTEQALGTRKQCHMCGETFVVSDANSVSLDAPPTISRKPLEAISPLDGGKHGGPQECARCGRPFRGEWDRYYAAQGMVCHVCAHLVGPGKANENMPQATPIVPPRVTVPPSRIEQHPPESEAQPAEQSWMDRFEEFKKTQTFRVGLYASAFSVIAIGIFYSFFYTWPDDSVPAAGTTATETAPEEGGAMGLALLAPPDKLTEGQHEGIRILVWVIRVMLHFLPRFLAILITLHMAGGLPGSGWFAASLHMAVVAIITALISTYVIFVGFLLALYVLYEIYDLGFGDLIKFLFLNAAFSFIMIPLAQLVYGGLALMLL